MAALARSLKSAACRRRTHVQSRLPSSPNAATGDPKRIFDPPSFASQIRFSLAAANRFCGEREAPFRDMQTTPLAPRSPLQQQCRTFRECATAALHTSVSDMPGFAWVTLATNDAYAMGALVLAHSLKAVNTVHRMHCMVTSTVSDAVRDQLFSVFNEVSMVDVMNSNDFENLSLISRPDLNCTFTKLHCWRLTQYEKCVFLDADTLVVQNSDELFERSEFAAVADIGWPDYFNTGVFVFKPSVDTYRRLLEFAVTNGSFDGGDQGLLNQFFANWRDMDAAHRLPFIYNMTAGAIYSYAAAYKQQGANVKIVHFIGTEKPWTIQPSTHRSEHVNQWQALYHSKVAPCVPEQYWISDAVRMRQPSVPSRPRNVHEFPSPCFVSAKFHCPSTPSSHVPSPSVASSSSTSPPVSFSSPSTSAPCGASPLQAPASRLPIQVSGPTACPVHSSPIQSSSVSALPNHWCPPNCPYQIRGPLVISLSSNSKCQIPQLFACRTEESELSESCMRVYCCVPPEVDCVLASSQHVSDLTPNVNRSSQAACAAPTEEERLQAWESGNPDYMGRDSFDNIMKKMEKSLNE
ncbi:hypothetical protein L596_014573 [Steinernema carpocapsae]|uniref:glycogenin glucosyltransferase n=2 Tax=Steinernema carpocapsae TaxID=34508 RepID=A0A4U5NCB0_STECR|nr:hypothetical protein L596_014573 [Steinernema carpocapsae]